MASSRLATLPMPVLSLQDGARAGSALVRLCGHLAAHALNQQEYQQAWEEGDGGGSRDSWTDSFGHVGACIEQLGLFYSHSEWNACADLCESPRRWLDLRDYLASYTAEGGIPMSSYSMRPHSFDRRTHAAIIAHLARAETYEQLVTLLVLMPSEYVYSGDLCDGGYERLLPWNAYLAAERRELKYIQGVECRHYHLQSGYKTPNIGLLCFLWLLKQPDCPDYLRRLPPDIVRLLGHLMLARNCQARDCGWAIKRRIQEKEQSVKVKSNYLAFMRTVVLGI